MQQLNTVRVWKCGCVIDPHNGILVHCAQVGCSRGSIRSDRAFPNDIGENREAWVETARLLRFVEEKDPPMQAKPKEGQVTVQCAMYLGHEPHGPVGVRGGWCPGKA